MAHHQLLHIYDADEEVFEPLASADYKLPVTGGLQGLRRSLDGLVSGGHTFTTAIILAHGAPGKVEFDGESLNRFGDIFKNPDYSRLFPFGGKIIFDGCNVAEGDEGTEFLRRVGSTFFLKSGGVVVGSTRSQVASTGALHWLQVFAFGPSIPSMYRGRAIVPFAVGGVYKAALFTPGGVLMHIGTL